ncbi:MAG: hypothetical protein KatS3mg065_0014 [Chloroflexota bacterium]|nr:MAG: hypothetical protein KatS3mg065_0014 [Chloroflexota bacterium]
MVRLDGANSVASRLGRPLALGLVVAAWIIGGWWLLAQGEGGPVDVRAYYLVDPDHPYAGARVDAPNAFLYSPAFAQATAPLRLLPWDVFRTLWRAAELAALTALAGPATLACLFVGPIATELNVGNIHLLLAAAIVGGFRWPAAWSFVVLTKVTPGIGLLWFAVRREWRALAGALVATLAVVALSALLAPGLWLDWIALLAREATAPPRREWEVVMLPLEWRIAVAAVVVAWGARNDRRWAVPIGAFLALPVTWYTGLSLLAGTLPFVRLDWAPRGRTRGGPPRADEGSDGIPAAEPRPASAIS